MGIEQFISRKTAVFSDIHSNYHALKACYEDAVRGGTDLFIFLGDYVSDLSDPQRVLDLVYEISGKYPAVCLRGNRERYMLDRAKENVQFTVGSKTGSLLYTYQQLREKDLDFFENLPIYAQIEINGIQFEIAHAAKEDDRFYFAGWDDPTEIMLERMECPYMLAGHSHKQFLRKSKGKTLLNPGSIGVPRDHGHLTQYAILEFRDNEVDFDLRQTTYDVRAMIHRQFQSGLMEMAPHWAISVLYDVITGEEYTMELLNQLYAYGDGDESSVYSEEIWHRIAVDMGMKFTEEEIVDLLVLGNQGESF